MPVVFNASKRIEHAEYVSRRDTTTREELSKLKKSPEYRKWQNSSCNSFLHGNGVIKILGALVALLMLSSIGYYTSTLKLQVATPAQDTMSASNRDVEHMPPLPTTPVRSDSSSHPQWMLLFEEQLACFKERAVIQKELSLVSRQLNATRDELALAMRSNIQLTLQLSKKQQQFNQQSSAAADSSDSTVVIASLTVTAAASLLFAIFRSFYSKKKTTHFVNTLQSLTTQLQEATFDKETAEQSVSILEQELQRKMKQLEEAKDQLITVQKSNQQKNHQDINTSPRIPALTTTPHIKATSKTDKIHTGIQENGGTTIQGASTSAASPCTPGSSIINMKNTHDVTPSTRELPPPPRQLVERFLQERRAVAIEEDQVQAWLQMESDFGRLLREVNQLRSAAEGRDADAQAIEELTTALEDQRAMARKAKDALKAVKDAAAANGGSQIPVI